MDSEHIQTTVRRSLLKPVEVQMDTTSQDDDRQTGMFLAEFTNSVSRALYKEQLASKKSKQGFDLVNKLNLVPFGPNRRQNLVSRSRKESFLPSINAFDPSGSKLDLTSSLPSLSGFLPSDLSSRYASVIRSNPRRSKMSESLIPTKTSNDLSLPKIMDFQDAKGNVWTVIKENNESSLNQNPTKSSKSLTHSLEPIARLDFETSLLKGTSQIQSGYVGTDAIAASQSPHTGMPNRDDNPKPKTVTTPKAKSKTFQESNRLTKDGSQADQPLEPKCSTAPVNTNKRLHCTNPSTLVYHDEYQKQMFLQKYNTDSKSRKFSYTMYNQYLRDLSELAYCDCQRDQSQDTIITSEKRIKLSSQITNTTGNVTSTEYDRRSSEDRNLYTRQGLANSGFPPELEELYSRGSLTSYTIDMKDRLPDDFLEQEHHELRQLYPMFDWKVEREKNMKAMKLSLLRPTTKRDYAHPDGLPALESDEDEKNVILGNSLRLNGMRCGQKILSSKNVQRSPYRLDLGISRFTPVQPVEPPPTTPVDSRWQYLESEYMEEHNIPGSHGDTRCFSPVFEENNDKNLPNEPISNSNIDESHAKYDHELNNCTVNVLQKSTSDVHNELANIRIEPGQTIKPAIQLINLNSSSDDAQLMNATEDVPTISLELQAKSKSSNACQCGDATHDTQTVPKLNTQDLTFKSPIEFLVTGYDR